MLVKMFQKFATRNTVPSWHSARNAAEATMKAILNDLRECPEIVLQRTVKMHETVHLQNSSGLLRFHANCGGGVYLAAADGSWGSKLKDGSVTMKDIDFLDHLTIQELNMIAKNRIAIRDEITLALRRWLHSRS